MSQVWELDLPPTEKLLLLCLADFASDDGENVYPSVATMTRKSSMSERTVRRSLRDLEAHGLLEVLDAAPGRVRRYAIRPGGASVAPPPNDRGQADRGGGPVWPGRGASVAPYPSVEPPDEPPSITAASPHEDENREAPPPAPSFNQLYLLDKLVERDAVWSTLTIPGIVKLNKAHGRATVAQALGYLREETHPGGYAKRPYALVEEVCQTIAQDALGRVRG